MTDKPLDATKTPQSRKRPDNSAHLSVQTHPLDRGVARILTLNRPAKRNALDTALLTDLLREFRAAEAEDSVRAVILAGNGPGFCGGGDLREFAPHADPLPGIVHRSALLGEVLETIPALDIPVIAAVHGPALGAGAALALSADLTIWGTDVSLGFPEMPDGVIPGMVTGVATRRFGVHTAFDLLTTGHRLTAVDLGPGGSARWVVEPEALLDTAIDLACQWSRIPREILTESKHLLHRASTSGLTASNQAGLELVRNTWAPLSSRSTDG